LSAACGASALAALEGIRRRVVKWGCNLFRETRVKLRSSRFALFLCLFAACARAQSPSDGHLEGSTYVNSFFHLAYELPADFQRQTLSQTNLPKGSPRGVEFFLFAARQGNSRYGIIIIAEKTRALASDPRDFQSAADLIARVKRGFDPSFTWKSLDERHLTNRSGLAIDEFDYVMGGVYSSAVVVSLDGYLVVARCTASSAADLKVMTDSLVAMRRTP
jgi:hypothetical protein